MTVKDKSKTVYDGPKKFRLANQSDYMTKTDKINSLHANMKRISGRDTNPISAIGKISSEKKNKNEQLKKVAKAMAQAKMNRR